MVDLAAWWSAHDDSHVAFVARLPGSEPEVVGMAWLALVPRVPRPGATTRRSADVQSVFVGPEQRGKGIGSALVQAASEHALTLGASRVTVHSGARAVPVYERLGVASSRQLLQTPVDQRRSSPRVPLLHRRAAAAVATAALTTSDTTSDGPGSS